MTKHKQVDPALAAGCAAQYTKIYKGTDDEAVLNAYSEGIVFDRQELIDWLNQITTPSIKIAYGVYTKEFANKYPGAIEGRLASFLWPDDTAIQAAAAPMLAASATTMDATSNTTSNTSDPLNSGGLLP